MTNKIGPPEKDFEICCGLAETLLRLDLLDSHPTFSSKPTPFIAVCNLGQIYWMNYRIKYEIAN